MYHSFLIHPFESRIFSEHCGTITINENILWDPRIIPVAVYVLSCVWLFVTLWTVAHQASLSFTISQSLLKLMSIELMVPSNDLVLCWSLLLLSSIFSSISGSFPMSQLFASGGSSIGALASASVLQHHSSKASILRCSAFFYCPAFTSIHDFWKNHSSDYMDLCRQSNVSAF